MVNVNPSGSLHGGVATTRSLTRGPKHNGSLALLGGLVGRIGTFPSGAEEDTEKQITQKVARISRWRTAKMPGDCASSRPQSAE